VWWTFSCLLRLNCMLVWFCMGDVLLSDRVAWAKPVAPSLATRWHLVWPDSTAFSCFMCWNAYLLHASRFKCSHTCFAPHYC
jgi:hypothetical protein